MDSIHEINHWEDYETRGSCNAHSAAWHRNCWGIFRLKAKDVPKNTILEVDFARNYEEYLPRAHLGRLLVKEGLVLRSVVESMLKVSEDERVRMLVAVIGGSGMGWRKIQEIRDAVIAFGKNGKSAIVFAETLGEFGPGNKSY